MTEELYDMIRDECKGMQIAIPELLITLVIMDKLSWTGAMRTAELIKKKLTVCTENTNGMGI